jgi:hypothetical protein
MNLRIYILFVLLIAFTGARANQIDIGIFESPTITNKIEVKIRPDFTISSQQTVTAILYTVRWDNPLVNISVQYINPFFIAPQGQPVENNGYYYQVFAAAPMNPLAMNANQEYIISSFTFTNGDCANFEIIQNDWTASHNGNVYLEFLGTEVSGIIYNPLVFLGSIGGYITGTDTIYLGSSTGPMILTGYTGNVIKWQRKINNSEWMDIANTAGLITYSEMPEMTGAYHYRAYIQKELCTGVYSGSLLVQVVTQLTLALNLKVFLEGGYSSNGMTTYLNQQSYILNSQPYSGYPWNYPGSESFSIIPNSDVVDWVLVELRETSGDASTATSDKRIARQAGLLLKNGQVVNTDGVSYLTFDLQINNNLYAVIWHRNHLAVMSAVSLISFNGLYSYDFTEGLNQVYGNILGHKQIADGIWGMIGGDGNGDGIIGVLDMNGMWNLRAGLQGYLPSDYNLDAQCNNADKNDLWQINKGYESQVPE